MLKTTDGGTSDALLRYVRAAIARDPAAIREEPEPVDWRAWETAAASHHVDTILAVNPPAALPVEIRERLQSLRRSTALYNLHIMSLFDDVATRLEANGIRHVVFKGPVAALDAFGALEARSFVDIDVLVPPERFADAASVLTTCGFSPHPELGPNAFRRYLATFRQMPYVHAEHPLVIELHTAPMPAYLPMHEYDPGLVARARTIDVGGVHVRAMSLEDHLLLLCMHGTKEGWPHLRSVADVAGLRARHPLDMARVNATAAQMHVARPLSVGLALADWLVGEHDAAESQVHTRTSVIRARVVRRLMSPRHGSTNADEIAVVLPSLDRMRDRARFVTHHASGFTLADHEKWPAGDNMLALTRITRPLRLTAKYVGKLLRRS